MLDERATQLKMLLDQREQLRRIDRFFEKITRAHFDRFHRHRDITVSCDHDDRNFVVYGFDLLEQFHAMQLRHVHIQQHDAIPIGLDVAHGLSRIDHRFGG
ncbi:Uncharacterised protein [Vibrio cholerae]|nr:Uncharacterised protein [Vibrio cholerae]CSB40482.1 Uncharacterised protein [Vibrio cholerae]CSC86157.1 Uncharacterised protein [Vibrio cholerae]CSI57345.1 Uncharacterised protein [Vibrio cholerae]